MSTTTAPRLSRGQRLLVRRVVIAVALVALAVAMVLNTRFLSTEEAAAGGGGEKFSAADYATENYADVIKPAIIERAVPAAELAPALAADVDAAGEQYGGRDGQSAWAFPVSLTGVAGEVDPVSGLLPVVVDGLPDGPEVFVQMGPAVNGSALRDVTGEISFGMFTNQLEFQSVSAELNNQVKADVLAAVDAASLDGETVSVIGAFSAANPDAWTVTPVQIEVAG